MLAEQTVEVLACGLARPLSHIRSHFVLWLIGRRVVLRVRSVGLWCATPAAHLVLVIQRALHGWLVAAEVAVDVRWRR